MSVKIDKLESGRVKLTFEIPVEDFEKAVQVTYQKQKKQITVPGFRKGKVPRAFIEKAYGKEFFYEGALNEALPAAYDKAYDEAKAEGVEPLSRPVINVEKIEAGQPVVISAEVAVAPEVELGQYKGVEITKVPEAVVSDEDVDNAIAAEMKKNSRTVEISDRAVEDGDIVSLDFEGKIDGVAFDGGKGEDYPLTIGSGSFIPGFEEQLIGVEIGGSKEVVVTFPEDYQAEELAGKEAVFACKINSIKKEEMPELNDEYVSDFTDFDTVDEYKADMKSKMQKQAQDAVDSAKSNACVEKAVENAKAEIDPMIIDAEADRMMDEFAQQMAQYGISMEQYAQMMGGNLETMKQSMLGDAEKRAKTRFVLDKIVAEEGIEVSDERVEEEYSKMADLYKMDVESVKTAIDADMIKKDLAVQEAVKLLADSCVEVEAPEEEAADAE